MKITMKRVQIDKAKSNMLFVVTVSTIVAMFCLASAKSLINQATYQRKVLHERRVAISQLEKNLTTAGNLASQYKIFNSPSTNLIGGKSTADPNAQPPDGDNARIVLNALPSIYDFPALISSVTKILNGQNIAIPSIGGADASASIDNAPTTNPQPQTIALTIGGSSNINGVQRLIADFERSIRPFDIQNLSLAGSASTMTISLTMNTYYQPAKSISVGSKVVR